MEALLKVIITPQVRCLSKCTFDIDLRRVYTQDPAEGFILNYTLLIGDASFSNFQKVCVKAQVQLYRVTNHSLLLCITIAIYLSIYLSIDDDSLVR